MPVHSIQAWGPAITVTLLRMPVVTLPISTLAAVLILSRPGATCTPSPVPHVTAPLTHKTCFPTLHDSSHPSSLYHDRRVPSV
jgi:hypothetical protein